MLVRVPVANVWTKPVEGYELALSEQGLMKEWTESLTLEGRMQLWKENVLQTQVLLGDEVEIVKEEGDWAEVRVLSQSSSKDKKGYPGWMYKGQLREGNLQGERFVITVPEAELFDEEEREKQRIVYQTVLPLVKEEGDWVFLMTPDGLRKTKRENGAAGADLLTNGKQFIGLPYLWGGTSAFGYDCSGFTYTLARSVGVDIPRDAHDQAKAGEAVERADMQPGDLLFFAYENGKGAIHHVAVYAGEGQMLHAPKTGKCIEVIPIEGIYAEELCAIRRVI
ncbi:C40 family peptidase [Ectobacillus sp. JY-23]|uniref:C40 family peptidase n=1 Tax=Ectobacillus sp. JY-23 TaxID=2933872 RepID=UPI001FF41029|nr:C40 family peptidase [Ectobacillus sp. JY-23]UOY91243.1 C40 family peptidase [Ectobacillus sp. JY-23]